MPFAEELRANIPSFGPDWDAAIEQGIDVTLLLENLQLNPLERLQQLEALHAQWLILNSARVIAEER